MDLDPTSRSEYEWNFMMYQATLQDSSFASIDFIPAFGRNEQTYFKPDANKMAAKLPY
jgi:hypothetical protein